MANKTRGLTLDLINTQLQDKDAERGFSIRVKYTPYMFRRQFKVVAFDRGMTGFFEEQEFRKLEDAVNCARKMDVLIERSQNWAVREATTR